jgi:hypothetical protein
LTTRFLEFRRARAVPATRRAKNSWLPRWPFSVAAAAMAAAATPMASLRRRAHPHSSSSGAKCCGRACRPKSTSRIVDCHELAGLFKSPVFVSLFSSLQFSTARPRFVVRPRRYEEFSNEVDEALRAATDISEAEYDKIFSGPSSTALESDDFLDYAATSTPHRYSSSSSSSAADGVPSSSWEDAAAELELASSRRRQDKLTAALQKQVCICGSRMKLIRLCFE